MKRLKLLTALAATAAATGFAATTAVADVSVTNPGSGFTLAGGYLDMDAPNESAEQMACNLDLEVDVDEAGAIHVPDIEAYGNPGEPSSVCRVGSSGSSPWYVDNCGQAGGGWNGQILGPGDEYVTTYGTIEYSGLGDFEAVIIVCTAYGAVVPARFAIDTDYEGTGSETWSLPNQPLPMTGWTMNGTGWDDPGNDLGLYIQSVE